MTLTATYLPDLSRVRLAMSSIPTGADFAVVERSRDGITWEVIRGGANVPITAGAARVDDYEFVAGQLNTYRASYVDSADISWIGSSGPFSGNNTSLAVAYNGGTATGDLILLYASIRNTAATVNTPAGWTRLVDMGNATLFGKYQDGAAAPTVTFTGGAAGDDTTAQTTTYRNAELVPVTLNTQINAVAAQNIAVPALSLPVAPTVVIALGWKQDDWSSAPTISGYSNELGQLAVTAGNDAGHVWWTKPRTSTSPEGTNTFVITGGATAVSRSAVAAFAKRGYLQRDTQTITPTPLGVWVKSITRPSLNQQVTVTDFSEIIRPGRSALFEIVGRTLPIANTELAGSQRFTLTCTTPDKGAELALDNALAAGDVIFLQTPHADCPFPTVYAVVGDVARSKHSKRTTRRYFDLPLTECAAPANIVTGDTVLWADIIATYATWQDLLNAKATWSDVIDSVSTAVVIVP